MSAATMSDRAIEVPNRADKPWTKHDAVSWPQGHAHQDSQHCMRCGRHKNNPHFHNIHITEPKEERPTPFPVAEVDMSVAEEHMVENNGQFER